MVIKKCIICGKEFNATGNMKCCTSECSKKREEKYRLEYYENHRDEILEYRKEYIENHRDEICEYQKEWRENNTEKRREANREWREANPEYAKEWYKNHRDDRREYAKGYYENNRDKIREYHKEYYDNHRDEILENQKEYNENHRDENREYAKEYRENNPDYFKEYYENNRDEILEKNYIYRQNMISELCEQYDGDLEQILANIPSQWHVREAQMRVWFNESYYEGMIAKIKSTPACEVTGKKTNDLVIHHLYSFNTHPELGNDPANMVRITKDVHQKFHSVFGNGNNTPEQWIEFVGNLDAKKR